MAYHKSDNSDKTSSMGMKEKKNIYKRKEKEIKTRTSNEWKRIIKFTSHFMWSQIILSFHCVACSHFVATVVLCSSTNFFFVLLLFCSIIFGLTYTSFENGWTECALHRRAKVLRQYFSLSGLVDCGNEMETRSRERERRAQKLRKWDRKLS